LIEKEVERGEGNLMKEGNARCVFVPQKPDARLSYGAFPLFLERSMIMIPLFQNASSSSNLKSRYSKK